MVRDASDHINEIKSLLVALPFVTDFEMLREETLWHDGLYRLRAKLVDGSELQMFERFRLDDDGAAVVGKYSFHWQKADGMLLKRWDNAPHHSEIPSFPHHVHDGDEDHVKSAIPMTGQQILKLIESTFA